MEKRIRLLRKDDSIVVKIKFVQNTNDSVGRKSFAKLRELAEDYKDRRAEGHKHIILVFVEKGAKSYLTERDINRVIRNQNALVMHRPKRSFSNSGPRKA